MTIGEVQTLEQQVQDLQASLQEASHTALEVYLHLEMLKTESSGEAIEELVYIQSRLWELSQLSFISNSEAGRNATTKQKCFQSGRIRASIASRNDELQTVAKSDIQLSDLAGPKLK